MTLLADAVRLGFRIPTFATALMYFYFWVIWGSEKDLERDAVELWLSPLFLAAAAELLVIVVVSHASGLVVVMYSGCCGG